jgi:hypothetical protein
MVVGVEPTLPAYKKREQCLAASNTSNVSFSQPPVVQPGCGLQQVHMPSDLLQDQGNPHTAATAFQEQHQTNINLVSLLCVHPPVAAPPAAAMLSFGSTEEAL